MKNSFSCLNELFHVISVQSFHFGGFPWSMSVRALVRREQSSSIAIELTFAPP